MKIETFKCDGCGALKAELNHWFELCPPDAKVSRDSITILPWPDKPINNAMHLCSDACVIKAVQQWLSAQKAAATT